MIKKILIPAFSLFIAMFLFTSTNSVIGQSTTKEKRLVRDCDEAKEDFIATDGLMENLFNNAGGIGIGGAVGNGVVYEGESIVGKAKLTQLSIGFQFGGQAYREVIFFESKADLDRFRENKIEFSAQASAVAVTEGASANVKYKEGVMIFTQQKGGLMYEASIGGQKFNFSEF